MEVIREGRHRRVRTPTASGPGTWRNEPVIRRWITNARPDSNRTIRYLPRRSTTSTRSPLSSLATSIGSYGTREPRVGDVDARQTHGPPRAEPTRRRTVSTSGSSGIPATLPRRASQAAVNCRCQAPAVDRRSRGIPPKGEWRTRGSTRTVARVARKPRVEVERGYYHVVTRGNNKQPIYFANWSGKLFEGLLGQTAVRFDWEVLAYCLMTNHYHLVVRIRDAGLSGGICELNGSFAKLTNRRTRTVESSVRQTLLGRVDRRQRVSARILPIRRPQSGTRRRGRRLRAAGAGARSPPPSATCYAPSFLATDKLLELFGRDPVQARARSPFIEDGRVI